VADFNRDGRLDFVVATQCYESSKQPDCGNDLSLYLGTGGGRFRLGQRLRLESYPFNLTAGDFDGDGNPDFAIFDPSRGVILYPGNGAGTFGAEIGTAVPASSLTFAMADVNGDRRDDLLVAAPTLLAVLLSRGRDGFSPPVDYQVGAQPRAI